jgi:hypothetical protein
MELLIMSLLFYLLLYLSQIYSTHKTFLPFVHGIVYYGVDTAVGHGQPVEGQEHVLGVPGPHDGRVVEGVHEVDVVGQPTHSKYKGYSTKHFHNLEIGFYYYSCLITRETSWG